MQTEPIARKIIIFLPEAAANVIVARLANHGYLAVAVSTVPKLFDALRSDECSFAVTSTPNITLLRNIRPVPVINMEILFHGDPSADGAKRFDGQAFMERVEVLSKAAQATPDAASSEHSKARPRKISPISHCWDRTMALLRSNPTNEVLPDARA